MPIYAYKCASCGFAKDVLQKISEAPLTVCPACGEPAFTKQVTAAGFQLKGSGWYATDFKGGGKAAQDNAQKDDAGQSGTAANGSDGKSNGDGDAKPADGKAGNASGAKVEPGKSDAKPAPAPSGSGSGTPAPKPAAKPPSADGG